MEHRHCQISPTNPIPLPLFSGSQIPFQTRGFLRLEVSPHRWVRVLWVLRVSLEPRRPSGPPPATSRCIAVSSEAGLSPPPPPVFSVPERFADLLDGNVVVAKKRTLSAGGSSRLFLACLPSSTTLEGSLPSRSIFAKETEKWRFF